MTPPNCTTDETRELKRWYLAELQELQDEVRELRCLQFQDRQKFLELSDLVRAVLGVHDDVLTIQ